MWFFEQPKKVRGTPLRMNFVYDISLTLLSVNSLLILMKGPELGSVVEVTKF